MKIIFLRHTISHLWRKIAIVWAIFGHFWHVFSDFLLSVTQLCSLWEPFQPEHSWPMWGQGFKPFLGHWAIHLWLGGLKMGDLWLKNSQNDRMPYWAKKTTCKLDNGPKHTPINGERCFGHFYAPSRCHSRSRWVRKWVIYGSKIAQNDRMPYWAKKPTWKLGNGPIIIHLHHAGQDGPFSSQWYCDIYIDNGPKHFDHHHRHNFRLLCRLIFLG